MRKLTISFIFALALGACSSPDLGTKKLKMLDTISFDGLSIKAYAYLNAQQDSVNKIYDLSGYENWYYDQHKGTLTFSNNGIDRLIINYEEVGSLSYKSNTWLWSWANPHVEMRVKSDIEQVRRFGETRNFDRLVNPKWKADEYDAWEMTAIAAYLMKAKGAYRVPSSDSLLLSFMIYKDIKWADSSKR